MKILVSTIMSAVLALGGLAFVQEPAVAMVPNDYSQVQSVKLLETTKKKKKHKINLARKKQWEKIAKCESGGRWHINTHNGYYGGLQFNLATWRSVRGQDFARYPHKASKAEQITVANRLYKKRGFKPWSCRHVLHKHR